MENGLCILKADILGFGSEKDEIDEQKSVKRKQKPYGPKKVRKECSRCVK